MRERNNERNECEVQHIPLLLTSCEFVKCTLLSFYIQCIRINMGGMELDSFFFFVNFINILGLSWSYGSWIYNYLCNQ